MPATVCQSRVPVHVAHGLGASVSTAATMPVACRPALRPSLTSGQPLGHRRQRRVGVSDLDVARQLDARLVLRCVRHRGSAPVSVEVSAAHARRGCPPSRSGPAGRHGTQPMRAAELNDLGAAIRTDDDLAAPPPERMQERLELTRELPARLALGERLVERDADGLEDVGLHGLGDGERTGVGRLPDFPPVPGDRVALRGEELDLLPRREPGGEAKGDVVRHVSGCR